MSTKFHAGKQAECQICNPEVARKRERRDKPKRDMTLEVFLRRAVAQEMGDAEVTREQRLALLDKYGVSAPRIDRNIKRPYWVEEKAWMQRKIQWFTMTKGLVPATQQRKSPSNSGNPTKSRPSLSEQKRQQYGNPRINPNPRPNQPR